MDLRAWVPEPSSPLDTAGLPLAEDDRAVLASVDGTRSSVEIARLSGLTMERALAALVRLHDLAVLRPAPVEVTAALAAYRELARKRIPAPLPLDGTATDPACPVAALQRPPPTLVDGHPTAFTASPTETELPLVPPSPSTVDADDSARFAQADPTIVEEDGAALAPSSECTVVDAPVLPSPEAATGDDDWGDEPGTLQDGRPPDDRS